MDNNKFNGLIDKISFQQYKKAVLWFLQRAALDPTKCGIYGQVLLSVYNSQRFPLNILKLCVLDKSNYQCALVIIRGRAELRIEPDTLIADGSAIFEQLATQWPENNVIPFKKPD